MEIRREAVTSSLPVTCFYRNGVFKSNGKGKIVGVCIKDVVVDNTQRKGADNTGRRSIHSAEIQAKI
ncbi:hypothetical protein [Butyrivibrio sp. INlla16]|uniref:hypothetical protein n=1 Tax=Butyrivibrio sp. INlla16 TaxID=1520807 RepID=UPI000B87DA41|nr:hypothetical protein [Butyrivibrio sp. INlla16]